MNRATRRRVLIGTAVPILASVGLYACKDTLTEAGTPQGALSGQVLGTKAGVEGSLVAAYRALDWSNSVGGDAWPSAASDWVWASVTSDDAYKGSIASDQPAATDIELYQWTTGNTDGYLNGKWKSSYEGVSRANATLNLLKQVQEATPSEIDAATAASIAGEAIFLRAHYHFEAWRMWGNIPYYRGTDTDFRKPNETSDQVVADLLIDLDSAIALLPATPRDNGRVSKWAAKAYKGRVQVYAGKFADAVTTLREVRAQEPNVYALETSFDHVWTAFPEYRNGKETILAYQASANDGDPNGSNANWGERLNFPHAGSPFGCCGFHQPSQNLVNFFAVDAATGLPLAITNPNGWNANNANFTAGASQPVDPRLDWTVGRDGVPYKDWRAAPANNGIPNETWNRDRSYGGPYSPKKNVQEQSAGATSNVGWTPTQLNSVPMHIFRYADMLLLLAEADVETGALEEARTIVNQIRTRAAAKAQGPGLDKASIAVPINDPLITWATYKVGLYTQPFASQEAARTAVRTERRLELAMEGQRFFDLKRWGIAEQTLNNYLAVEKTRRSYLAAATPFAARNNLYPIPSVQIELSKVGGKSQLEQNTGW